jgi:hypothetical protein
MPDYTSESVYIRNNREQRRASASERQLTESRIVELADPDLSLVCQSNNANGELRLLKHPHCPR